MTSQQLLYFNIIAGLLLVAYFLLGNRTQKQPTKLNLKQGSDEKSGTIQVAGTAESPEVPATSSFSEVPATAAVRVVRAKNLSIIFMYNGHDWEAHDVLGIPQGASLHVATQAYQELLKTAEPSSLSFVELAYNAILLKHKNEKK